jgi:hypothetical protein
LLPADFLRDGVLKARICVSRKSCPHKSFNADDLSSSGAVFVIVFPPAKKIGS